MTSYTSCFVRVVDMAKRKELTEWLAGLGYRVCKCCMFDNYNALHCCAVDRGVACYEVHGIPDYDEESGTGIELFKAENIKYGSPSYDCGENIELFKALASMLYGTWDCQYVVDIFGHMGFCELVPALPTCGSLLVRRVVPLSGSDFSVDNYRCATFAEIVNYFKTRNGNTRD